MLVVALLATGVVGPEGPVVAAAADDPVVRVAGDSRIGTAVALSTRRPSAATVVVARSDDYPDALAGSALAAAEDAPLLLSPTASLPSQVATEIARLGATRAIVLGGTSALSEQVEDDLAATGITDIDRVGGRDRFQTAALIAERLDADRVLVVEGAHSDPSRGWPDAVAASALSAHTGWPLLLVTHDTVPAPTARALTDARPAAVTIVGGPVAVSEATAAELGAAVTSAQVTRVAGQTRYETSAAVAALGAPLGMDPVVTWLATGRNWPDALTAGVAAAAEHAPLLLVDGHDLAGSPPVHHWLATRPVTMFTLAGGPVAISEEVEAALRSRFVRIVVEPRLATAHAATSTIDADGGQVVATGPDGSSYRLTVPRDAVVVPTAITLTPYAALTGLPGDVELAAGVDLAPDGLSLAAPAALRITPASRHGTQNAFGVADDGYLSLKPAAGTRDHVDVAITHFSGAGVLDPSPTEGLVPGGPAASGDQSLQEFAAAWRITEIVKGAGTAVDPAALEDIAAVMEGWLDSIIARAVVLLDGGLGDDQVEVAASLGKEVLVWAATASNFGLFEMLGEGLERGVPALGGLLRYTFDAVHEQCGGSRTWSQISHDLQRLAALAGTWTMAGLPDTVTFAGQSVSSPTLEEIAADPCASFAPFEVTFPAGHLDGTSPTPVRVRVSLQTEDPGTGQRHTVEGEPIRVGFDPSAGVVRPSVGMASEDDDGVIGGPGAVNVLDASLEPSGTADGLVLDVLATVLPGILEAEQTAFAIDPVQLTLQSKPAGAPDSALTTGLALGPGESAEVVATMTREGQPLAGRTLELTLAGGGALSHGTATLTTDGQGRARTTYNAPRDPTTARLGATFDYVADAWDPAAQSPEATAAATIVVEEPRVDIAGPWAVTITGTAVNPSNGHPSGFCVYEGWVGFTQDGSSFTVEGAAVLTNSGEDCRPGLEGEGVGELDGRDIVFGLAGGAAEFDGAVNESSDAMQGTWSGVGFAGSGNWSASR